MGYNSGLKGMYQQNTTTNGTEVIIPSYKQFDLGAFAMAKKTLASLILRAVYGTMYAHLKTTAFIPNPMLFQGFDAPVYGQDTVGADHPFADYSHTFAGASGSIGATYNFTDKFSVKANISRGYRAPNISEISSNGVHPGTDVYQIGNPAFKLSVACRKIWFCLYIKVCDHYVQCV